MGWTGARPRKIAFDINFTKPTNRDGAKIILMKSSPIGGKKHGLKYATQPLSPFDTGFGNKTQVAIDDFSPIVAMPEPKRAKKPLGMVPGPSNYSPRYDGI